MRSFVLCLIFVGIDQITKALVVADILHGERVKVIPGIFNLTYITNPGAAWGILAGKGNLLLIISGIVFCLAIYFIRTLCEGWKERYYAVFMVLSGIIGNSLDRVFRGSVVDFLDFHFFDKYHWPSFNVADSCICAGVFIFVISSLLRPQPRPQQAYVNSNR